jgi:hypothetical protein
VFVLGRPFQLKAMFASKPRAYPSEATFQVSLVGSLPYPQTLGFAGKACEHIMNIHKLQCKKAL